VEGSHSVLIWSSTISTFAWRDSGRPQNSQNSHFLVRDLNLAPKNVLVSKMCYCLRKFSQCISRNREEPVIRVGHVICDMKTITKRRCYRKLQVSGRDDSGSWRTGHGISLSLRSYMRLAIYTTQAHSSLLFFCISQFQYLVNHSLNLLVVSIWALSFFFYFSHL
jgi:hypothetical protein